MPRDQSPVLPGTVAVRFRPWLCDPAGDWTNVPSTYQLTTSLADAAADLGIEAQGSPATRSFRDTCHALFTSAGGDPTNKAALQALTDQVGADFWAWRSVAYDRAYNGVVAPVPDGTVDAIAWTYREDDASTRIRSVPIGGEPVVLCHDDAADDCDGCARVYPTKATVAGGTVSLPRAKLCLEAEELVLRPLAPDTFAGCCGGGGGVKLPQCFCTVPATLSMISNNPSCNYGMFQSCTIQYGPPPPAMVAFGATANLFTSTQLFHDPITDSDFFYYFACQYNQFFLSRIFPTSPLGSPYRDGFLYNWVVGGYGNSCPSAGYAADIPFQLLIGTPFPGSEASCSVQIVDGTGTRAS